MIITKYDNGNALISIFENGDREIEYENELNLEYPLNIDIKVTSKCAFGLNPLTNKAFCSFCHEEAKTDGEECNFEDLKEKLKDLPKGIELAIGANELTTNLYDFLQWCWYNEYICNLTINQGHIKRDYLNIISAINDNIIKGLGISYRSKLKFDIPEFILNYPNTVFHVITGINTYREVENLAQKGVKKLLILGEKDFGFNKGKVNLNTRNHKEWYWWVHKLFKKFEVVSFDNLALEQLNIKRFFTKENYNTFHQGEHSFYIDAVNKTFAPSSRSEKKESWSNYSIKSYFKLNDC